jgi:hypothetical protein
MTQEPIWKKQTNDCPFYDNWFVHTYCLASGRKCTKIYKNVCMFFDFFQHQIKLEHDLKLIIVNLKKRLEELEMEVRRIDVTNR